MQRVGRLAAQLQRFPAEAGAVISAMSGGEVDGEMAEESPIRVCYGAGCAQARVRQVRQL